MRVGGHARVIAHDVRLQDAEWRENRDMLRISRLEAEIDLLSLLHDPIVIERIVIRDASVHFARNDARESNWALGEAGEVTESATDGDERKILLRRLDVADVDISLETPERPEPLELRIARLQQDVDNDDVLS